MATRAKRGSKNGVEWHTISTGETRYRGVLNTKATGKQNGPWLPTHSAAKAWRVKAQGEAADGTRRKSSGLTLQQAWDAFYKGAQSGAILNRSGNVFRPSTLHGYKSGWDRIAPELGAHKLDQIKHEDWQALVDRWLDEDVAPATIRNSLDPIRSIYRRALRRREVAINPTTGLEVPAVRNGRERFASKAEAVKLLDALPDGERAMWATAFYGGLRRGELRGLRWSHVHLGDTRRGPHIHVQASWLDKGGDGPPKSDAGNRKVPVVPQLAALLEAHKATTGRSGSDLVFGRSASEPFTGSTARNRALAAWKTANKSRDDDDQLLPITLHECRHTCASLLIHAHVDIKTLSIIMGHEKTSITLDRYGHLMPGGEALAGQQLAAFLDAA